MPLPLDATVKDLARESPRAVLSTFDAPSTEPLRLLNVDLSTVTTAADVVIGLGDPLREILHFDFQASAAASKSPTSVTSLDSTPPSSTAGRRSSSSTATSPSRTAVEDYQEEASLAADSPEAAYLRALRQARFSFWQIEGIERGMGIRVRDLLNGEARFLVDVGLSTTAPAGGIMAARVITYESLTGAASIYSQIVSRLDRSGCCAKIENVGAIRESLHKSFHGIVRGLTGRVAAAARGQRPRTGFAARRFVPHSLPARGRCR